MLIFIFKAFNRFILNLIYETYFAIDTLSVAQISLFMKRTANEVGASLAPSHTHCIKNH